MASLADTNAEGEFSDEPWWKCPCLKQMSRCCCPSKEGTETEDDDGSTKKRHGKRAQSVHVAEGQLDKLKESEDATKGKKILPNYLPLTFTPDYVIYQILKDDALCEVPYAITTEVVLLMADVSGFTSLCESYWQKGVTGIEEITKILRGFMSTVSAMLMVYGGDILNFAGDAFFVQFWVDEKNERYKMSKAAIQAYKCAVALQTHECLKAKNLDGTLKIKIGIASGKISNWCFGSEGTFLLHVASGPSLPRVNRAESLCSPGDIIVNRGVYEIIKAEMNNFTPEMLEDGFVKITEYPAAEGTNEPVPDRIQLFQMCGPDDIEKAKLFLIPGLRGLRNADELQYVSELTTVSVVFIALLNIKETQAKVDSALLDKAFKIVLETAKMYEGALNKMIMFDKGCNFLVIFGLPGLKHTNDAARSIRCAQEIVDQLKEMDIKVSIGISSGTCYCGIVGHPQRQEYTVIGSSVNMAARIMVIYNDQEIAVNSEAYHLSRYELDDECFVELPRRKMKGIDDAGTIYAYRKSLARSKKASMTSFHIVEGLNLYGSEGLKANIMNCVKAMTDGKKREALKLKNLLPVIVIKGHNDSGKIYINYFTLDCALSLGYRFAACCCISSFLYEPFGTICQIMRRMLQITMLESYIEREDKLMSYLPKSDYSDLYLLNHLFNCEFPVPDTFAYIDLVHKREKITNLFQGIVHEFCKDGYTLISIDNADYIDEYSWTVLLRLAEKENVLIMFNLNIDFKEADKSSSILLLKAFKSINTDSIQEDIFAPALCWNLHVKAVHTTLFIFLKEITGSKLPLLKEIVMSSAFSQAISYVSLDSIEEERLKKEFFVNDFKVLHDKEPLACDLKPGVDLKKAMIPTNINDTVKESLNNLSIQERVLLKQAAVLGPDFNIHSLEAVSTGMERSDVLQSVSNLLANHIFSSACALENRCEISPIETPTIAVDCLTICFCFTVYLKTGLKGIENAPRFPVGPYHRLCFRTIFFRSAVLGDMTTEQIYSMRMKAADNLELRSIECATCKSSRTEGLTSPNRSRTVRRYSTIFKDCVCMIERPRIYSEISMLYSTLGMIFLPLYFKRKAAQAANDLNFPIQALYYVRMVSEKMPQYSLMSEDDFCEEEAFFDPLVLDVSLLKTKAVAFLRLGDHYNALKFACQGIEMLELDFLSFYGAFKPKEFKGVLSKFRLLRAETITKLIPVLANAHLGAFDFFYARNLLRIEHHALNSFPIDFVQIVNHMAAMYKFKYLVNERNTLRNLERNIFRLCRERLRNFDKLIDLTEIAALGDAYFTIMKINFFLERFRKAKETAKTAILILKLHTYQANLPILRIFLALLYLHLKDYENCLYVIIELFDMTIVQWSRKFHSLALCCVAMLVATNDVKTKLDPTIISKCNTLARTWKEETSRILDKKFAFYISVVMSLWCLYADKNDTLFAGKYAFLECYELAKSYQNMIGRFKFDYWTISGLMLLLKMEIRLIKETYDDIDVELIDIQNELNYLKDKVKIYFPLYLEEYKELSKEYEKSIPKHESMDSLERMLQML